MLTINPELTSFQTGGQSWGVKDVSPRKMNQDLCPLSDFTPQPGDSHIRLNRKRRWSLVLKNTVEEVVRKPTGSEERKQITVKRAGVIRDLTGVHWPALNSNSSTFWTFFFTCSPSRILSPHSDYNPHRLQEALASDTVNIVTLT